MVVVVISMVILAFMLIHMAVGGLRGFFAGAAGQGIRFGTVVVSILLAFLMTKLVSVFLISSIESFNVMEALETLGADQNSLGWLLNADSSFAAYILALPLALIVLPAVFVPFFILFFFLTWIVSAIICKKMGIKDAEKTPAIRIGGVAIGILQGIIVASMILLPLSGISSTVEETMNVVEEKVTDEASNELVTAYNEVVAPVTESFPVKTLSFFGGDMMYSFLSTVNVHDTSIDTTEILPDLATIYANILECEGMDWKSLTPQNENSIRSMVETFKNDEFLTSLSAEIVSSFATALASGDAVMELEGPFESFIPEAALAFTATNSQTVGEDLETLMDVYFILSRDGFFVAMAGDEASDAMLSILTKADENGNTTVTKVIEILRENERTSALVTLISKISVAVMAENMDLGEDFDVVYENVKGGINTTLAITKDGKTEEEYVAEVSDSIDNVLKENNITVEKGIVDEMAKYVSENFEAGTELSDDDVNNIIISYYDAYLEYLANGGELDSGNSSIPEDVIPEDIIPDNVISGGAATTRP
jgi:hypothetical protein